MIDFVVFPTTGVLSVIVDQDGESIEAATIGREGAADLFSALGSRVAAQRLISQVEGESIDVAVDALIKVYDEGPTFQRIAHGYVEAVFAMAAVSAACLGLHHVNERCARWLLETHDRVDSDTFELKQEFLAMMLGVHRPSVSIAASTLQAAGAISYSARRDHRPGPRAPRVRGVLLLRVGAGRVLAARAVDVAAPSRACRAAVGGRPAREQREGWDSNPRAGCPANGFQDRRLRPLGHPPGTASVTRGPLRVQGIIRRAVRRGARWVAESYERGRSSRTRSGRYGCRTFGSTTVPSACWWFSRIAIDRAADRGRGPVQRVHGSIDPSRLRRTRVCRRRAW